MRCAAIGGVLAELLHEPAHEVRSDAVNAIVVIPELRNRRLAFIQIVHGKAGLIANDANSSVFDRSKTVRRHRQAGDFERHGAQDIAVVQRHLQALVEVLVVHVMDAVHRMHIGPRQPLHHAVELGEDLVIVEILPRHRRCAGRDLIAGDFVPAAVDHSDFFFTVYYGYYAIFEAIWNGQTPGKRLLRIRVIKETGRPITPVESVARNLLRIVDQLPAFYAVGIASVLRANRGSDWEIYVTASGWKT